jgi:hypothetical protein
MPGIHGHLVRRSRQPKGKSTKDMKVKRSSTANSPSRMLLVPSRGQSRRTIIDVFQRNRWTSGDFDRRWLIRREANSRCNPVHRDANRCKW